MTPGRLRLVLGLLRWSQRGLAEALECDDRLVRRWASGHASSGETLVSPTPPEVAAWLEALAAAHEAHPVPQGWRRQAA